MFKGEIKIFTPIHSAAAINGRLLKKKKNVTALQRATRRNEKNEERN